MAITAINLSSLDGSNGFRIDDAGYKVSSAGDINGDGFDDVMVSDYFSSSPDFTSGSGSSYVVFGQASGFSAAVNLASLDGSNGFHLDNGNSDSNPVFISDAGDVNGDGFDDVIIGAVGFFNYYTDPDDIRDGASYVVFGRASGFAADMDLSTLDGSNGFRPDVTGGSRSFTVSSAGDVNGDGFADLIIGTPFADSNGDNSGSSYVVFGEASGFAATLNLSNLDGSNGFRLDGVTADDRSGSSVSSAGDINGDGFADLIIGTPFADPSGSISGSSYVVFGKAAGFAATLDLSSLDGNNGFRLDGIAADDRSGFSISKAGDVNGDGFDDVIIGAPYADSNGFNSGSSYVVFGQATGFAATLNLSTLDGSNGFSLHGAEEDQASFSVSGAGDVNGDGFADLLVGVPRAGDGSGSSYVVFGKASGFAATLNLSNLDRNDGFRLDGESFDSSGSSVSNAGDVNGDGFDDLIVGARYGRGSSFGTSYVIFGRSSFTGDDVIQGTPGNDKLTGTAAAERFEAGDGDDTMIGRGGADVFHGDAGDDYIQVLDLGFGSVDGGTGSDVLHTDGKDLNLDLANFGDKIQGIETICLFGRGDNELTLTAADLLNLSNTDNTLRVNGNAGDHITVVDDGWVDEGSRGLGYFHVYTNDEAVLLVGMNVTIDFV